MSKLTGLSTEVAHKKHAEFGANEIREVRKNSPYQILLRQVEKNYIIYLLLAASAISFFVGKNITAYTIIAVIVAVVGAGFIQEFRAEKAIAALKSMLVPKTRVIRGGKEVEVLSEELVPGDIVLLRSGEKVPADCLVLEESEIRLDESILTGESTEVKKVGHKDETSANDENKVFMGSFVLSGRCVAKILHIGMNTKFGNIAGMVSTAEKQLPLQDKINKISTYMVFVALTISAFMGAVLFFRAEVVDGVFITETLILMIALSVSAFPEGLPLVLITTLAAGSAKMAKKNAIVNRMSVIESLGETTVICTDKTGTVTSGEMTVKKIVLDGETIDVTGGGFSTDGAFLLSGKAYQGENKQFREFLHACIAANDAKIERTDVDHKYTVRGSTTEAALLILAGKHKLFTDEVGYERLEEVPFTSERKMMSVLVEKGTTRHIYVKGAPEVILKHCKYFLEGDRRQKLTEKMREHFHEETKQMAKSALRTLAFAYKEGGATNKYDEEELVFLGIAGMEDPPREEVKEAIETCNKAGIKVKLITGDNRDTAVAVAKQVGISGKVIDGDALESMSDEELRDQVLELSIFVRVKPEHKLRIVRALKENNEIVAMTGDGVNDAPALKEAHIGIAMGIKGTDVSRSVSDLILRDDNFATIVTAISEGRTIFNNIRKFVSYQLSCNMAELMILLIGVLIAPVFGWEVPVLLAIQILFMNLVTDNLPALTLGFNPMSPDVLRVRAKKKAQILDGQTVFLIVITGFSMCLATLATHFVSFNIFNESAEYARTQALISLILIEIAVAFSFRSFRKNVLTRSLFTNKYLVLASAISILATIVIVYTHANVIFETVVVDGLAWWIASVASFVLVLIYDIGKVVNKHIRFLPSR